MLKLLRHKGVQKNIYIALAVMVVISFVITGVQLGSDDHKISGGALATINGQPVTVQQYLDSYRAVQRQASFMYGEKLKEVQNRINFKGEAWDRLLLLDYAKKHHIRATDDDVVKWLTSQTAFQNDGRFDEKLYTLYVERAFRSTPRAFEEEIRQMLTIGQTQDSLKASSPIPDDKLKEMYAHDKSEKDIVYALVTWESQKDKVPPADGKSIEQLLAMTKDKPMTGPDGKTLTPEEAQARLKDLSAQTPATELAMKKLNEAKDKMKTAADFETALQAEGITPVPIGKYHAGMYPGGIYPSESLHEAVDRLQEGQVSDVFQVPAGAMIVKVAKVYPLDEKKFEEEKEAFRKEASEKNFGKTMSELMDKLRGGLKLNLEHMKQIFPEDAEKA